MELNGEDNYLTDVIVFDGGQRSGVLVNGAATLLQGVHSWGGTIMINGRLCTTHSQSLFRWLFAGAERANSRIADSILARQAQDSTSKLKQARLCILLCEPGTYDIQDRILGCYIDYNTLQVFNPQVRTRAFKRPCFHISFVRL